MGDMSECPHNKAVGYCDICSPNWEEDLFNAGVQDTIYAAGIRKGRLELQQENEKLKADVARLRDQYYELAGIAADVDAGNGFDVICRRTLRRVMDALYATASSDAWLKERDAESLADVSTHVRQNMQLYAGEDIADYIDGVVDELLASASQPTIKE